MARRPKADLSIGVRVWVYPSTAEEALGTVVEDFGEQPSSLETDSGSAYLVPPARRWAVNLDDGGLVFVDSEDLGVDRTK